MSHPQSSPDTIDPDKMFTDIESWLRDCLRTFRRGGFGAMEGWVTANPARAAMVLGVMSRTFLSAAEEVIDESMNTKETTRS